MASTVPGSATALIPFWDPPGDIVVNGERVPRRMGDDADKPILYGVGPTYLDGPDTMFIGGVQVPGLCRVHATAMLAFDKKKTAGSNGARPTTNGYIPAPVDIEVVIWTQDQWTTFLQKITPIVWGNPKKQSGADGSKADPKKSSQAKGAGSGNALTVSHPALDYLHLGRIVVVGAAAPEPGPWPQSMVIRFKTHEYVPDDKKAATNTVKAAVKNAALDPHLEPAENLGGRAPPSTTGLDPT